MPKMDLYSQYIHLSRYARWDEDKGRRETWEETVDRYISFFMNRVSDPKMKAFLDKEVRKAILNLEVMPSMRCLMTAGKALDRDNVAGFNCAYAAVDHQRSFDEILYILMCGTGDGFSVERFNVDKLPTVSDSFFETDTVIKVPDSKKGWAKSFRELIALLYSGQKPKWDTSAVRPAGTPLKTFGGRASGPEPLEDLFRFTTSVFEKAKGRRLNDLECHDIVCKVAQIVVVGGVRRSALISLSDLDSDRMRGAKNGQWWVDEPQRALANNSAVYNERPAFETFMDEWSSMYKSKAGERGIFSRQASQAQAAKNGRRDFSYNFGTNPCSEIILRSNQFCNLSEVVIRKEDSYKDVERKVKIATVLGTLQSTLTDFSYLRNIWKRNTEEERLLGVSMTGICDNPYYSGDLEGKGIKPLAQTLRELRQVAVDTNKDWAEKLGIPQSTAVTCVKPSGTVSQLVNSASGIHARFSPHYIRRVRGDKKDPITKFMQKEGFPWEDDVMNPETVVFSFPQKAPEGVKSVEDFDVKTQLDLWEIYQDNWCEHKPSVTVYYTDEEFLSAGQWVWERLETISGISFLPKSDHIYQQAPYEEITEEEYNELKLAMPDLQDWSGLGEFEQEDNTVGMQELACSSGVCEIL